MKILCFGSSGLVASELKQWLPELSPESLVFLSHQDCDITSEEALSKAFNTHTPTIVINAAAYTAVDDAEDNIHLANQVNGHALKQIAEHCDRINATLIHFSTDYVFNGKKEGAYDEEDPVAPINAYGESKLLGESMIQKRLAKHYIIRIQWVYGVHQPNFVDAIINKAKTSDEVNITFESKPMDVSSPAVIYEDEMMKRFSQMNQFMKQGMPDLPKKYTCILNSGSSLLKELIELNKAGKTAEVSTVCQQVVDLAVMSNQPLEGDRLQQFLKRSFDLLNNNFSS